MKSGILADWRAAASNAIMDNACRRAGHTGFGKKDESDQTPFTPSCRRTWKQTFKLGSLARYEIDYWNALGRDFPVSQANPLILFDSGSPLFAIFRAGGDGDWQGTNAMRWILGAMVSLFLTAPRWRRSISASDPAADDAGPKKSRTRSWPAAENLNGPFNPWLRSPELADRFQNVGEYVRYRLARSPRRSGSS